MPFSNTAQLSISEFGTVVHHKLAKIESEEKNCGYTRWHWMAYGRSGIGRVFLCAN